MSTSLLLDFSEEFIDAFVSTKPSLAEILQSPLNASNRSLVTHYLHRLFQVIEALLDGDNLVLELCQSMSSNRFVA
jgi:hypothetical protein